MDIQVDLLMVGSHSSRAVQYTAELGNLWCKQAEPKMNLRKKIIFILLTKE